jgi:phenylalanyl-tRNA synthetase beta chain
MIVTYNWLKEFVDIDLSPSALADLLTMLGLEVEGVQTLGGGLDEVVVARVVEKAQHPNADKLSLCKVDNGREMVSVVCGASNFVSGDTVALAQVGAVLPGDFRIKKSKIRGEESFGMLCSEKELGLAEESAGIMILPKDLPLGSPLFEALGMKDTIFEIGLTPNRADCLSVIGVAREIAAKVGKKIHYPGHSVPETGQEISSVTSVTIDDTQFCPRYAARHISGCRIAPSPAWLVSRLQAVGVRAINNVVDVTNYVLMEYGHPLHAFDFDRLAGGKIVVRRAEDGEKFVTLDGQERTLTAQDLTIRDGERAVALAGIMGGENSEIAPETTNILLESAFFNPMAIRRTSKRLGIHSESSHRFERGADVSIVPRALDRAASLIAELAGGSVAVGVLDKYPATITPRKIEVRLEKVNSVLGLHLSSEEVSGIFENLEFSVEATVPERLLVTVPTFRVDIEREIDLIEEVARLAGYEKIEATMPVARVFSDRPPVHQRMARELRNLLVSQGFSEVVNFSFIPQDLLHRLRLTDEDRRKVGIPLRNPLSDDQGVMRTTLLPGLLQTAVRNISHRNLDLRLFELRRVYFPQPGEELPREPLVFGALLTGRRSPEGWNHEKSSVDFFDAKGIVEDILDEFRVESPSFEAEGVDPFYHPGKACSVIANRKRVGSFGELHPDVLDSFDAPQPVYYVEIDFEALVAASREKVEIVPPSRFPDTFRDVAMLVDAETPAAAVLATVREIRAKELEGAEVFDVYTGAGIAEGKKSIAVRVRYRSLERTLTDEEVTRIHTRIVDNLIKKLDITVR